MISFRLAYSGVRHAFFRDHPFSPPRYWRWTVTARRPADLDALDEAVRAARGARAWAWAEDVSRRLDEGELREPPYDLLTEGEPHPGWVVDTAVDPEVRISHEGRPHHLVFAFDHGGRTWCGSWVVDYSGFVHDDTESLRSLVQGWIPGRPVVLLLPGGQPRGAVPLEGLQVVPVV